MSLGLCVCAAIRPSTTSKQQEAISSVRGRSEIRSGRVSVGLVFGSLFKLRLAEEFCLWCVCNHTVWNHCCFMCFRGFGCFFFSHPVLSPRLVHRGSIMPAHNIGINRGLGLPRRLEHICNALQYVTSPNGYELGVICLCVSHHTKA